MFCEKNTARENGDLQSSDVRDPNNLFFLNSRFSYCESILAIDLLPISFKNNDLFSNMVFFFLSFCCQKRNNNIEY
jgi:hypothetical protein